MKVEATVLNDGKPQHLVVKLPDGRCWQELFLTSQERVLNVINEIKQGDTVEVILNERMHKQEEGTQPFIEGIVLPEGITPSGKKLLYALEQRE